MTWHVIEKESDKDASATAAPAVSLVDGHHAGRAADAGRLVADDRCGAAPATLTTADGQLVYSFSCPRHGEQHVVPYTRAFARQYAVAAADGDCLCPGRAPWHVRFGVSSARVVFWLLLALWVFNFADFLLTQKAIAAGRASEANGVMSYFLNEGLLPALIFKVGVVTAGVLIIWRVRRHNVAILAAGALATVYAAVVMYQALWVASF
jgi:hypothetical protein